MLRVLEDGNSLANIDIQFEQTSGIFPPRVHRGSLQLQDTRSKASCCRGNAQLEHSH